MRPTTDIKRRVAPFEVHADFEPGGDQPTAIADLECRIKAGEQVSAIPTEIKLRVGDKLVVRNQDRKQFEVGPYVVRPGDTLVQEFHRPQTLIGECLVTPTGQVRIVVTA